MECFGCVIVPAGIVYVFSQKDAEVVASDLEKKGIVAYPYHAQMDPNDKSKIHRKWTNNKIQVLTNAKAHRARPG